MKKLFFLLNFLVVCLLSCHGPKPKIHKIDWNGYRKAYAMLSRQNDSAFYYFNKVASNAKDSLPVAMAYNNMAVIQSNAGDYYGALESLTMSLNFLNETSAKDQPCLTNDYNELGMNSADLKNFNAAIGFFDKALSFTRDSSFAAVILNNKALAYKDSKNYQKALALYQKIMAGTKIKDAAYARALTNLAITKWLFNPSYKAAPELLTALAIRQRTKDLWGQNSSYDHLADYYLTGHPDSTFFYSRAMYEIASRLNSPDDRLTALEKLIKVGPAQDTKRYFALYQSLNDSVQTARNAAKNQFALIRYNVEKSKSENLALQKDNLDKKYQLAKQRFMLYSSILGFIIVTIMITYWFKKRRQQAVRENQLRLSNKVHSRVANGLYQLMQEIDNHPDFEKERVVRQLNVLYERSRDISHEQAQQPDTDFAGRISQLLTAFGNPETNVAILGNDADFWRNVDVSLKSELEQILQEWMVNMKKHSEATRVSVRFERLEQWLHIYYTDNGIGLPEPVPYGTGIQNTGNRIKILRGTLTFDTGLKNGLRMHLALPLA